jgi:transposase
MKIVNPHAGGIDCGAQEHYAAVPPQSVKPGEPFVRCFSAFSQGLDALVEWLKACGVTTVAIESTGVYWIALCQKLEAAGIEVFLVNARHVRHVPGRKTDVKDCQWLQRLSQLRVIECLFPARGRYLPAAKLAAPSTQFGLDGWGRNSAHAKGLATNESASSSRRQRHYRH